MGCDIHFRVEFFAPNETVVQTEDGSIAVAPGGEPHWQPGETFGPSPYLGSIGAQYERLLKEGSITDSEYDEYMREMSRPVVQRLYSGRNYALFWKLSGVRGPCEGIDPMSTGNGFPDDMSEELREEFDNWGLDLHSETHYTLTELLEHDWKIFDREHHCDFHSTVQMMEIIALEKCGGNTDHVRACFGYDN